MGGNALQLGGNCHEGCGVSGVFGGGGASTVEALVREGGSTTQLGGGTTTNPAQRGEWHIVFGVCVFGGGVSGNAWVIIHTLFIISDSQSDDQGGYHF